jgi:threonyl-tRNA synthetase
MFSFSNKINVDVNLFKERIVAIYMEYIVKLDNVLTPTQPIETVNIEGLFYGWGSVSKLIKETVRNKVKDEIKSIQKKLDKITSIPQPTKNIYFRPAETNNKSNRRTIPQKRTVTTNNTSKLSHKPVDK